MFSPPRVTCARPCQDRKPLCNLPPDLGEDDSLQAQIELCYESLKAAREGNEVESNLLKWCDFVLHGMVYPGGVVCISHHCCTLFLIHLLLII